MWLCIVFSGHLLPKGWDARVLTSVPQTTQRTLWLANLAFTAHFLPLTDCPCTAHWGGGGSLLLPTQTSAVGQTALGCQQNYWQQISGHQRIYRKSIICQHSTCVFRVVKRCAQTDNCLSMGYKGGTVLKAWFGMKKQRFPSTNPIAIQDSHWLFRHTRQHELTWTRNL